MERKRSLEQINKWKNDVIAVLLLGIFAFFINRGIEIKGLYMDDLYLWSCYGEQSFMEFNFPIGSTRFRFLYYLMAWLELAFVGNHVTWFVPINIVLNTLAAGLEFNFPIGSTRFRFLYYLMAWLELAFVGNHVTWFVPINIVLNTLAAGFVYWFGTRLAKCRFTGFLAGILYLLSRMSYYQISQVYGLMETAATIMALGILICLYLFLNEEGRDKQFYAACILYFAVCFVHERYLALLPLIYLALLLTGKREEKPDWKKWLSPLVSLFPSERLWQSGG